MSKYETNISNAINECYILLYEAATPSGDFLQMVEDAVEDKNGLKHIPFIDYELDFKTHHDIINATMKKFKIRKDDMERFKNTIYLGSGPKFTYPTEY